MIAFSSTNAYLIYEEKKNCKKLFEEDTGLIYDSNKDKYIEWLENYIEDII